MIKIVTGFFVVGIGISLWMLIKPNFFVRQTVYWNKWFLNLIGYEVQITPKPAAVQTVRAWAILMLLVFLICFASIFDLIMMSVR